MSKKSRRPETVVSDTLTSSPTDRTLRPGRLIPFSFSQEEAAAACAEFYRGRFLLPGPLRSASVSGTIQGGFVPYILYSGTASFEILYEAQDSVPVTGDPVIRKQLKEYSARREGTARYTQVQVNASKDVPDSFMHRIEPYRYSDLIPVEDASEALQIDELESIGIEEDEEITRKRLSEVVTEAVRATVHHNYVSETGTEISFSHEQKECVLFPLWIMTVKCGRRYYHFAMNGQTGMITGDLPVSQGKSMLCFLGFFAAGFGAAYGLLRLIALALGPSDGRAGSFFLLFGLIAGLMISSHFLTRFMEQMRPPAKKKADARRYESCSVELNRDRDKLMQTEFVDAKNRVVKTEERNPS